MAMDNMYVTYENVNLKLPIFDLDEVGLLNLDLYNPYSDMNLQVSGTSFVPKKGLYDSLLGTVSLSTSQSNPQLSSLPINNGDTRSYVKRWLMLNEGLTNEQASALTGVWYAESGLKPEIHEIGKENNPYAGKGIALWTGKLRLQHAEDIYKRIYGKSKLIKQMTLDEQLTVAISEFKERTGNWNSFKNSKDLKTATDIVWRGYENGGNNTLASMALMNKAYKSSNVVLKQWNDRFRFAEQISKI